MRINKKLIKKRRHTTRFKIPEVAKNKFLKEFRVGNVPSDQQLKLAVEMGLVTKDDNGKLNQQSLIDYFKTFIQQRYADDKRS